MVEKGGRTYFKYTVKVSSENGTAGQLVTIDDVITSLYNLTGSYDKDSFELTKKDGTKVDLTGKLTFASDGKSFKIENLESLDKGEFYELTYLYEVRHSGEKAINGARLITPRRQRRERMRGSILKRNRSAVKTLQLRRQVKSKKLTARISRLEKSRGRLRSITPMAAI